MEKSQKLTWKMLGVKITEKAKWVFFYLQYALLTLLTAAEEGCPRQLKRTATISTPEEVSGICASYL